MIQEYLQNRIAMYGYTFLSVFPTEQYPDMAPFTYSVGLTRKFGFELLMVGLRAEHAYVIMNDIAKSLNSDGEKIMLGEPDDRFANLPMVFKQGSAELVRPYVIQADEYYQKPVNVVQCVMCDADGLFPWEDGYNAEYMKGQALLYVD